jgi:hypothetical protein
VGRSKPKAKVKPILMFPMMTARQQARKGQEELSGLVLSFVFVQKTLF